MKDLNEATETLNKHVEELSASVDWATDEIRRLRAENEELKLKVANLNYYIRMLTQGMTVQ